MTTGKQFSIHTVLRALRRRKLFIVLPVLLITPAVYLYVKQLPERFRTRATVAAEQPTPGLLSGRTPPVVNVQDQMREIRETIFSPSVLEGVIREFDLYDLDKTDDPEPTLAAMKSRVTIQVEGPDAFTIGFEGEKKGQVAPVANRLAGKFIERTSAAHGRRVEQQDSFLDREVARLQGQLRYEEEGLKTYRQSVAQELPEFLAANLKQLEGIQTQINRKSEQITELEARRSSLNDEIQALEKARVMDEQPAALSPAEVTLTELRSKLKQLRAKYTPEHLDIKRTEKEIQDLERTIVPAKSSPRAPSDVQLRYVSLQAELKSIEPRLISYRQEREALAAQTKEYERRVNSTPGYETSLSSRARDVAVTRSRYEALLAKQQEARLTQRADQADSASGVSFRIAEPAQTPTVPYSPRRIPILLLGFLASLGLGIAAIVVAERVNDTFHTPEEFEGWSDLPVLASVPAITEGVKKKAVGGMVDGTFEDSPSPEQMRHFEQHRLPVLTDPQSVASQQYGIMALKVCHWMAQTNGRVLAVTSSTGEEGKSVTALNLALALASSMEDRVLLVDCDLRLPQVHERLSLNGNKGFSELLSAGGGPIDGYRSYVSKVGKLDVITGGTPPANPVGLLASQRARRLLTRFREDYRLVVLDSPPVVPIADSHVLAGLSDGVVFVVRARRTRPVLFERAVESLNAPNIVGVVLNDVEYSDTPYEYAYQYYRKHYLGRS